MTAALRQYGVVIVGGGPAGLAPLFAAASTGTLQQLLRLGVAILERSHEPGPGALTEYAIRSDSSAEAFLDIVLRSKEPRLQALAKHPITQILRREGKKAAPLTLVASFLSLAGGVLCDLVDASPRGAVLRGTEAVSLRRCENGRWITRIREVASGVHRELSSDAVVLALGAHQPEARLICNPVAGKSLLPAFGSKLIQSGAVLSHDGLERIAELVGKGDAAKVTIIGGSTSAGAVAVRLLGPGSPLRFGEGGLTLMHRKPLRIFYESAADALAESYDEFAPSDVCPITGRIFRLSGFRLDSRELIMAARQIGGREPEPRLRLLHLSVDSTGEAQRTLADSDLIVAALGYTPRTLPVLNESGDPLPLHSPAGEDWAIVDQRCRLMTGGAPLSSLFAIGLAVGPAPAPELGGESEFRGQVNSLWMWQHTLGSRIVSGILDAAEGRARRFRTGAVTSVMPAAIPAPQLPKPAVTAPGAAQWV